MPCLQLPGTRLCLTVESAIWASRNQLSRTMRVWRWGSPINAPLKHPNPKHPQLQIQGSHQTRQPRRKGSKRRLSLTAACDFSIACCKSRLNGRMCAVLLLCGRYRSLGDPYCSRSDSSTMQASQLQATVTSRTRTRDMYPCMPMWTSCDVAAFKSPTYIINVRKFELGIWLA